VSRGAGQSAVRIAAYQARERLQDERTGYHYNYLPREQAGIAAASAYIERGEGYSAGRKPALFVGLYAPEKAPGWCRGAENVETFWNHLEVFERRRDAQIAERIIIALPHELTLQQNIWLLQDHVKEFTRQSRVVQVAIHEPEHSGPGAERNIHAHLLVSLRGVDEHGFKASKAAEQQLRYLHRREYVQGLRAKWTDVTNRHLARHGHEARIDHRTLEAQGIDRAPTIHLGPGDSRRERQGESSVAGEINREIGERNAERERQSLDQVHNQRHAEHEAEVVDLDAWRRGLEQDTPEAAQTREAAQGSAAPAMSPTASGGRRRAQEAASEDDAAIRAIDAWRSGVEREWQGQGSPVKPVALDPEEETRRARLEKTARLDRKPGSRAALTVEDVARELAPEYRDALVEGQKQTGAIAKAEGQIAGARKNRAIAEANIEDRQRQMPGWRRALHNTGLHADIELTKWQKQVKISEIVEERGLTHRTTARDALRLWERRAGAALEAVRPAAARELAQRQERAEKARAQLVRRGAWIGEPEEAYGIERDDLAAWHGFRAGEMRKAETQAKAVKAAQKAQKAVPKRVQAPQAPCVTAKTHAQSRRSVSERQEDAVDRYIQGMIARHRSRPENEEEEALRQRQRQRQGPRQRL
jgi:hypothetical protein